MSSAGISRLPFPVMSPQIGNSGLENQRNGKFGICVLKLQSRLNTYLSFVHRASTSRRVGLNGKPALSKAVPASDFNMWFFVLN
jgi:hypothetical protein